jgi:Mrp family chromosome partitioning ATPase
MALVLDELAGAFDYVIIDAPPLLPVTDATILAKVTSGALLVVAMGRTTRKQLETARASLDAANAACLGVVINKARQTGSDRYSSNYSSHAANTRRTTRRPFARR